MNAYLALGYQCDHECICCPLSTYDKLHAPFSYDYLKEIIDVLFEKDEDANVVISGGEPTLHPDFFKVLELINRKRGKITVLSNAGRCSDPQFVKKICDTLGENSGQLSYVTAVHSTDPDIHDAVTQTCGSLERSLKGVENLSAAGIKVIIKHIMSKISYKTMKNTFEELDKRFPPEVSFHFCAMDFAGRGGKNVGRLFVDFRTLQPYLEETLDLWCGADSVKREIIVFETPLCAVDPYYWRFFRTNPEGYKEYLSPSTRKLISDRYSKDLIKPSEICGDCGVKDICEGVWPSAYETGQKSDGFIEKIKLIKQ